MVIICWSKRSAERVMSMLVSFVECKLLLKVNRERYQVAAMKKIKLIRIPCTNQKEKDN
jgi:hypothetical protein